MDFALVRVNLERVREEIVTAQSAVGITGAVRIVAVTKGHSLGAIEAAAAVGLEDVGENRVAEGLSKRKQALGLPLQWHLIGHLQSNKVRDVPGNFSFVHSVDSVKLGHRLSRAKGMWMAEKQGDASPLAVLVQVNVSGEVQKSGCAPEQVEELVDLVAQLPDLELRGLMTMAPFIDDERRQREVFAMLRELRDGLRMAASLPELSMGMSGDFRAAVAEGATLVRLGTALFGERVS